MAIALVAAFDPEWAMAQTAPSEVQRLVHESWTFKEGAPEGVTAFAQTADGYLWVGAPEGLFRFDGVRFELFRSPFGDPLHSTNVSALFAGGDRLWVGYVFGGFSLSEEWPRQELRRRHRNRNRIRHGRARGNVGRFIQCRREERAVAIRRLVMAANRRGLGYPAAAGCPSRVRPGGHPVGLVGAPPPGVTQATLFSCAGGAAVSKGRFQTPGLELYMGR